MIYIEKNTKFSVKPQIEGLKIWNIGVIGSAIFYNFKIFSICNNNK